MANFNQFGFLDTVAADRNRLTQDHKMPFPSPGSPHTRKDVVRHLDAFTTEPGLAVNFHVMRVVLDADRSSPLFDLRKQFEHQRRQAVGKSKRQRLAAADIGLICRPAAYPFEKPCQKCVYRFVDALGALVADLQSSVLDLARTGCDEPARWPETVSQCVELFVTAGALQLPTSWEELQDLIAADQHLDNILREESARYFPGNPLKQGQLISTTRKELFLTAIANSDVWAERGVGAAPEQNWRGFLLEHYPTIMHRRACDMKTGKHPVVESLPVGGVAEDEEEPMANVERREQEDRLHAALEKLTDEERVVLYFYIWEDWTVEAIAKSDGDPVEKTQQTIDDALEKLRELL